MASKKFIYSKTLESFLNRVSEINKEDICFIEETKQIYTHENYFDCSGYKLPETGIPAEDLENSIQEILNVIISSGPGTKYLSDDGTYKEILTETFTPLSTNDTSTVNINPNNIIVFNSTQTFESKSFNIIIPEEINKEYTWTLRFVLGDTTPSITFNTPAGYTLKWANNTVPTFSANTAYEITFKHIPGVNLLLGVCGGF